MSRVYFLHAFFYKHLRGREGRWAWGMQDLGYVTRGWSRAPSTGSTESWPLNTKKSIQTPKLPVFWPICRENTQLTRLLFPNLSHLGLLQMVRLKTSVHPNQSSASPPSSGARKWKVKVSQSCPTLCDPHGRYSPWNSPGPNTGVASDLIPRRTLHSVFLSKLEKWSPDHRMKGKQPETLASFCKEISYFSAEIQGLLYWQKEERGCSCAPTATASLRIWGAAGRKLWSKGWPQKRFALCTRVQSLQSCPTLWPMDCSPPGSPVHWIAQPRILKWVAMPSSRRIFPTEESNPCLLFLLLAGKFFTTSSTWEAPLWFSC